jgi:hypothetical protein
MSSLTVLQSKFDPPCQRFPRTAICVIGGLIFWLVGSGVGIIFTAVYYCVLMGPLGVVFPYALATYLFIFVAGLIIGFPVGAIWGFTLVAADRWTPDLIRARNLTSVILVALLGSLPAFIIVQFISRNSGHGILFWIMVGVMGTVCGLIAVRMPLMSVCLTRLHG